MWERLRDYFLFTKKERLGALTLLVVVIALFVLPYFLKPANGSPDPAAYKRFQGDIARFDSTGRGRYQNRKDRYNGHEPYRNDQAQPDDERFPKDAAEPSDAATPRDEYLHTRLTPVELFYFDPNRLSFQDWQRLGLTDRLILTITHYTQKGGVFRQASDLKKIYGMQAADYRRLFPYVRIADQRAGQLQPLQPHLPVAQRFYSSDSVHARYTSKQFTDLDINRADSSAWVKMPGIGASLARRILRFRERLGGFYSVDQVGETFGLPDSVFQRMRAFLHVDSPAAHLLNIDTASEETLGRHPYIGWQLARAIVRYREQHGPFSSPDGLRQLTLPDDERLKKLMPYLTCTKTNIR